MKPDEFKKYLKERYENQIQWYDTKSMKNKKFYIIFQWGAIVLSATVPVLVVSLPETFKWITAIIAVILAIGTAALKTFKFQENWINYRTIAETLKKEKYFYEAGLDDFADASDRESLFVKRVESLISRENCLWVTTHSKEEEEQSQKSSSVKRRKY